MHLHGTGEFVAYTGKSALGDAFQSRTTRLREKGAGGITKSNLQLIQSPTCVAGEYTIFLGASYVTGIAHGYGTLVLPECRRQTGP